MMIKMQGIYGGDFNWWCKDDLTIQANIGIWIDMLKNIPNDILKKIEENMHAYFGNKMPKGIDILGRCKIFLAEKNGVPDAATSLSNGFCNHFAHPAIEAAWRRVRSEIGQQSFHEGKQEDVLAKFKPAYDEAIMSIENFDEVKKIGRDK